MRSIFLQLVSEQKTGRSRWMELTKVNFSHPSSVQLHICQRGSIINALSVKAISRVKFNGAYGK